MKLDKTLKSMELFSDLMDEEIKELEALAIVEEYEEDQEIFHESSKESDLYFLIEGRVQAIVALDQTEHATLHTILPGKLFGEFAFIDEQPRSASTVAIKHSKIIKFRRKDLFGLFEKNNRVGYTVMHNLCKILSRRIRQSGHELKSSLMWEKIS